MPDDDAYRAADEPVTAPDVIDADYRELGYDKPIEPEPWPNDSLESMTQGRDRIQLDDDYDDDYDEDYDEDDDYDDRASDGTAEMDVLDDWNDWEDPDPSDRPASDASDEPPPTTIYEVYREPVRHQQSGTIYSYSYRNAQNVEDVRQPDDAETERSDPDEPDTVMQADPDPPARPEEPPSPARRVLIPPFHESL